ncbi:E3 ubiquitin-protein ligase MARCHF6-like [Saccoglossus kowalevskii]|uniref:RING-type E3 ubiquitin transferase n=1 Tax=Saccoglossus kowalevskii TaxID=10224 RepID=A0ABM0GU77_SACKO|nr:PREDICTED: E3 ubiquitin-protein ligase MARCH6-like [Saccoglossus kowalevskii]
MEDGAEGDICRVCRSEGAHDRPLFHPCICTGSIKFIHQDCLLQWLKHSKKEYCELCKHKFSFTPIYSPDMPSRLPIKDIVTGLTRSMATAVKYWFHYTLVTFAWLGVVPLTACRIYRSLFTGSLSSLLTLPIDMLSTDNLLSDCFQGCFVVTCTLCAFISLVWLREQILHGGGPEWLDENNEEHLGGGVADAAVVPNEPVVEPPQPAAAAPQPAENNQGDEVANVAAQAGAANVNDGGHQAAVQQPANNGAEANNGAQEDVNWNALEWDRAAEELTWERMLGLDGSLVFLEHVFWVVSLNTLFILVFAFCPYHIGRFSVMIFGFEEQMRWTEFDGLLTTMCGYIMLAMTLVLCHCMAVLISLKKCKRILGLCYVVVKVFLLVVVEIGIFPLICGWWLDICSLSMFDATIKDRETSFKSAPGTAMFLHWLVGMVYVFYFASFILLLREVLRPGVLWFLRNLNDPDFNPVQEMIHLPIYRHARRFLLSIVVFGSTVLLMLWMPVQIIKKFLPNFLPYNVLLSSDAPVSELSLELLLLQVVLPALLEQGHTRTWLKNLVRAWTVFAAYILNLRSYLLGDVPLHDTQGIIIGEYDEPENNAARANIVEDDNNDEGDNDPTDDDDDEDDSDSELDDNHDSSSDEDVEMEDVNAPGIPAAQPLVPAQPVPAPVAAAAGVHGQALHAAHEALLNQGGPTGFKPYKRPIFFGVRLILLVGLMCLTLLIASFICLTLPVTIGRAIMSLWMGESKVHELYTAACGLYVCWVFLRAATVFMTWIPQGWIAIAHRVKEYAILALKALIVAALLIGLVPLLLGLLFELVIVAPLRVPLDQSPVFFPWQDWALGVLHTKIICAITMMGPSWWLKRAMEQVYQDGFRNLNIKFILQHLAAPVLCSLLLALTVPYFFAAGVLPLFSLGEEFNYFFVRRIYPSMLLIVVVIGVVSFQARQFKRLYEHIKNERYLVGQRLVNYERRRTAKLSS